MSSPDASLRKASGTTRTADPGQTDTYNSGRICSDRSGLWASLSNSFNSATVKWVSHPTHVCIQRNLEGPFSEVVLHGIRGVPGSRVSAHITCIQILTMRAILISSR